MSPLAAELLAFDFAPATLGHESFAFDRLSLRSYDKDSRLHVEQCNISKATVNPYFGREIPNAGVLGLDPNKVYYLYRHPDELAKAAPTFARLQLLDLHTPVHADDPKLDRTCGTIGSDVVFESPYLKASLAIWTRQAIDLVKSKLQAELSSSYRYTADMTPGVTPAGVAYDGVMRDIVGNHVALVKEGRAGPDVCVSDSLPLELRQMKFSKLIGALKSVIVPGTDLVALDAQLARLATDEATEAKDAFEKEEACDAREEALDAREEAMDAQPDPEGTNQEAAKGDRKKARDKRAKDRKSAKDKRAADKAAADAKRAKDAEGVEPGPKTGETGAALDAAIKAGTVISRADATKLADDAVKAAISSVNATTQARKDVEPLVGAITVAMDSAQAVYEFALKQVGVSVEGIHPSALPALVAAEIKTRKATATQRPALAADAVTAITSALPVGRIRHAA